MVIAESDRDLFALFLTIKRKVMKKFLSMTLLLTAMFLTFSACSSDDETNYPDITGSWSKISETPGEYISSYMEVTWTFNSNNTATQRVILKFNDVTSRDTSTSFTYEYKGSTITLKNDKITLEYEISVSGNKMKLGNAEDGYFDLTKK